MLSQTHEIGQTSANSSQKYPAAKRSNQNIAIPASRLLLQLFLLANILPEVAANGECRCTDQTTSTSELKKYILVLAMVFKLAAIAFYIRWRLEDKKQRYIDRNINFLKKVLADYYDINGLKQSSEELKFAISFNMKDHILNRIRRHNQNYSPKSDQIVRDTILKELKKGYDIRQFKFEDNMFKVTVTNEINKRFPGLEQTDVVTKIYNEVTSQIIQIERTELMAAKRKAEQEAKELQWREQKRRETIANITSYSKLVSELKPKLQNLVMQADTDLASRLDAINLAAHRTHAEGKIGHAAQQVIKTKEEIEDIINCYRKSTKRFEEKLAAFEVTKTSFSELSYEACIELQNKIVTRHHHCSSKLDARAHFIRTQLDKLDQQIETFTKVRNHGGKNDRVIDSKQKQDQARVSSKSRDTKVEPGKPPSPEPIRVKPEPVKSEPKNEPADNPITANRESLKKENANRVEIIPSRIESRFTSNASFFKSPQPSLQNLLGLIKTYLTEIRFMLGNMKSYNLTDGCWRRMFSNALAYNMMRLFQAFCVFENTNTFNSIIDKDQVTILRNMLVHLSHHASADELVELATQVNVQLGTLLLDKESSPEIKINFLRSDFFLGLINEWRKYRENKVEPSKCLLEISNAAELIVKISSLTIMPTALDEQLIQENALKMLISIIGENAKTLKANSPETWEQLQDSKSKEFLLKMIEIRNRICHEVSICQLGVTSEEVNNVIPQIVKGVLKAGLVELEQPLESTRRP